MSLPLPTGEVVFCFTDVEGSTRLAHELGSRFAHVSEEHRRIVRAAVADHGGHEVSTHGDAFFVVFTDAPAAVGAAMRIHADLEPLPLRVRIGLHSGIADLADGTYLGTEVNRAARIGDAAHGGQTLVSSQVRARLDEAPLVDLGSHRLKGFVEPVVLHQAGTGTFPPPRTLRTRTLPAPADRFVGRQADLERLNALVADGARVVTLVGTGGSGKTRLLVEAAAAWDQTVAGGVHWLPLADVERAELVASEISRTFGVDAIEQLPGRIGDVPTILLLDNAEHLVAGLAETVGELVRLCPSLTIVATSRERLRVVGEQLLPLRPLDRRHAVELFVSRARQLNPLYADDADAIDALCARLDDLPLAIELAAARTTLLGARQLAARLGERLDLLVANERDARQRTLQATVEWSYGLLSPEERLTHARMSVFAGGCTLESAEEVTGAGPDQWQSLVEKSLLEVDHHFARTRLTMLETIRAFAAASLAAEGGDDELVERYVDHYLRLAEEQDAVVRYGDTQLDALAWFTEELANLRHAFELSIARADGLRAARLAGSCAWTLWLWNHREAYDWRRRALALPFDAPELRVRLLTAASQAAPIVDDGGAVPALLAEADAVAEQSGDPFLIAHVLDARAFTVPYAEARPMLERAQALMRELGRDEDQVRIAINLGALALASFAWEEAAADSEHALGLVSRSGNRDGIATAAVNLAQAVLQLGENERALELVGEVRTIVGEIGDRALEPVCDFIEAVVASRRGDAAAAAESFARGETLLAELGWMLEDAEAELRRQARVAAGAG